MDNTLLSIQFQKIQAESGTELQLRVAGVKKKLTFAVLLKTDEIQP